MKFSFCKGKQLAIETFSCYQYLPQKCSPHGGAFIRFCSLFRTNPHQYVRVRGRKGGGGRGEGFTLTGVLFIWHVRVFYILTIDMYKRLSCNRQLPGNECVSSIIVIIQFSPVSYINKINYLFILEIQM